MTQKTMNSSKIRKKRFGVLLLRPGVLLLRQFCVCVFVSWLVCLCPGLCVCVLVCVFVSWFVCLSKATTGVPVPGLRLRPPVPGLRLRPPVPGLRLRPYLRPWPPSTPRPAPPGRRGPAPGRTPPPGARSAGRSAGAASPPATGASRPTL